MKKIIKTENAPSAVGPYSQGIAIENLVFTSGQLPMDPQTGKMLDAGIGERTELVIRNLKAVLEQAGSSLDKVIKCTIFLTDMGDFGEVNKAYSKFFTEKFPARSCVAVKQLPLGSNVEIEAIAFK